MGIIQSSVNNMLNTAALVASLSTQTPQARARAAEKQAAKKEAEKQARAASEQDEAVKQAENHLQTLTNMQKQMDDPKTSPEERESLRAIYGQLKNSATKNAQNLALKSGDYKPYLELEKAFRSADRTDNRREMRKVVKRTPRNFKNYTQNIDTSFGKLGDLPENLQRAILQQAYPTSYARQKEMDRQDALKGGKKGGNKTTR